MRMVQSGKGELIEALLLTEELLGDVREDGVLPDEVDPRLVEVVAHEVARSDRGMPILQQRVGPIDDACDPDELDLRRS